MEAEEQGVEESVVVWTKNNEQQKVRKLEGKIVFFCLTKNLKIKPLFGQNARTVKTKTVFTSNAFTKRTPIVHKIFDSKFFDDTIRTRMTLGDSRP